MDKGTCSVETCDRPAAYVGLCKTHYGRKRRTGDVMADVPIGSYSWHPPICSVDDCSKRPQVRDLCAAHYRRLRMYGDPLITIKVTYPSPLCSVEGCDRNWHNGGLCGAHYKRMKAFGDPTVGGPLGKKMRTRGEASRSFRRDLHLQQV